MKTLLKITLISFVAVFLVTGSAMAVPLLTISSGSDNFTIYDQDFVPVLGTYADGNPTAGATMFVGSVGSFTVNVVTGLTKPLIGDAGYPRMHLDTVTVSGGTGTVSFSFSEDAFTSFPYDGGILSAVGGTSGGTVAFESLLDTTSLSTFSFGSGAFSGEAVATPFIPASFSLTLKADVIHSAPGQVTSFDFDLSPVPEPATMLLLGTGLIGLAGVGRKKLKK